MKRSPLIALAALAACSPAPQSVEPEPATPPSLEVSWRIDGLANPESVALSSDGTFLYVTNVNGEGDARDGNGFISRVSTSGEILQREWARGLDGPKGVALNGDALWVADIAQVVVLDANTGAVRRRIAFPEARFLNDLAFAPDGAALIADSGAQRIYALRGEGGPEVWLEHAMLDSINGFLPEANRLIVTTMQGRLLAIDYQTRAITTLAEGLGEADGVADIEQGQYLVSAWSGQMRVVAANGSHQTILDTREERRFLNDFLLVGDILYQPHWEPSALTAYRVVRPAG